MSSSNQILDFSQRKSPDVSPVRTSRVAAVAWVVASVYYFYQYVLRSAPSVMMPELARAFGISTLSLGSIIGFFYYGYSPFSLVSGAAMDRLGPRKVVPVGALVAGVGALLFAMGSSHSASIGRFLQGAGGVFAPIGAIYIASTYFPPKKAATLVGATQMFGMAGGAAGQFLVGPLVSNGMSWNYFWLSMGIAGIAMGFVLAFVLPQNNRAPRTGMRDTIAGFSVVFRNPQSVLCGLISGLLFIPTTIFSMIWGVRFLQQAHGFDFGTAVMRSATIPLGWIIGCPLLGFISDRVGRRKPVIAAGAILLLACLAWILFGDRDVFPPYVVGLVAGLASGAAMLPYTVIQEANPPQLSGTATGVVNFLNFTFSALLAPLVAWILHYVSGGNEQLTLAHYQETFALLLVGVALAIALTLYLKETGPAATTVAPRLTRAA